MSDRSEVDVVIIGGGVFGCAVAWSLARKGLDRVVLLERADIGTQTTSRAASVLTCVADSPAKSAIFRETWRAMAALEDELGESLHVHAVGSLHVAATEAKKRALDAHVSLAEEVGEDCEELGAKEAGERVRWLSLEEDARCLFLRRAGYVDSYLLATAYARAARSRGVEIRLGEEVQGLCVEGNRVVGVETRTAQVRARWVVNCAGPWAGVLAAEAGWHLPMAPVRSQFWITEPREEFDPEQPVVFLPDVPAYARGEVGGLLFGLRGGTSPTWDPRELPSDIGGLRVEEDPEGWETLEVAGEAFARFCPLMETVGISHYVSGPSTYTPDGQFVIGECPGIEGFLVVSGCCGSGIAASGGVGRAIAELVVDGSTDLDLEPFRADRFGRVESFDSEWLDRCAATRAAKSAC